MAMLLLLIGLLLLPIILLLLLLLLEHHFPRLRPHELLLATVHHARWRVMTVPFGGRGPWRWGGWWRWGW